MQQHKIMSVPDQGPNRSILTVGGRPALCGIVARPSTVAHARIKVALATPAGEDLAVLAEFRLELN